MPFTASRRRALLSATATVAAALALGASTAAASGPGSGCPSQPVTQPFAPWGDDADYFLAPGGDLSDGGASWSLSGGAAAVVGDGVDVGGAGDDNALGLRSGASATTADFCIGKEHPTMRFFLRRGAGLSIGVLQVEVLYTVAGRRRALTIGALRGDREWSPSRVLALHVNELAPLFGHRLDVALRFTAVAGSWSVDDVFVDPVRHG